MISKPKNNLWLTRTTQTNSHQVCPSRLMGRQVLQLTCRPASANFKVGCYAACTCHPTHCLPVTWTSGQGGHGTCKHWRTCYLVFTWWLVLSSQCTWLLFCFLMWFSLFFHYSFSNIFFSLLLFYLLLSCPLFLHHSFRYIVFLIAFFIFFSYCFPHLFSFLLTYISFSVLCHLFSVSMPLLFVCVFFPSKFTFPSLFIYSLSLYSSVFILCLPFFIFGLI